MSQDKVPPAPVIAQSLAEEVCELAESYRGQGIDFVLVCLTEPDGPAGSQILAETVGIERALVWLDERLAKLRTTLQERKEPA